MIEKGKYLGESSYEKDGKNHYTYLFLIGKFNKAMSRYSEAQVAKVYIDDPKDTSGFTYGTECQLEVDVKTFKDKTYVIFTDFEKIGG